MSTHNQIHTRNQSNECVLLNCWSLRTYICMYTLRYVYHLHLHYILPQINPYTVTKAIMREWSMSASTSSVRTSLPSTIPADECFCFACGILSKLINQINTKTLLLEKKIKIVTNCQTKLKRKRLIKRMKCSVHGQLSDLHLHELS